MVAELRHRIETRGWATRQDLVAWILGERPSGSGWSHPRGVEAALATARRRTSPGRRT